MKKQPQSLENTPHQGLVQQLDLMIRARYPLLYVVTAEEDPLEEVLYQVAEQQNRRKLLCWDIVRGWDDNGADKGSAMAALGRIAKAAGQDSTMFVLRDLHPYLRFHYPYSDKHSAIVRKLRNLTGGLKTSRQTLILTSNASWLMRSKHLAMSASSTNLDLYLMLLNIASTAS